MGLSLTHRLGEQAWNEFSFLNFLSFLSFPLYISLASGCPQCGSPSSALITLIRNILPWNSEFPHSEGLESITTHVALKRQKGRVMVPSPAGGTSLLSDPTPGQGMRVGSNVLVQRGAECLKQKTTLPLAFPLVVSAVQSQIVGPQLLYHHAAHTPTLPFLA